MNNGQSVDGESVFDVCRLANERRQLLKWCTAEGAVYRCGGLGRVGSVGQTSMVDRHLGIGWEYVHVCVDDASRVAFVQVMANQRKESAVAFLVAAVAYYAKLGISIERVMTDNGSMLSVNRVPRSLQTHS